MTRRAYSVVLTMVLAAVALVLLPASDTVANLIAAANLVLRHINTVMY